MSTPQLLRQRNTRGAAPGGPSQSGAPRTPPQTTTAPLTKKKLDGGHGAAAPTASNVAFNAGVALFVASLYALDAWLGPQLATLPAAATKRFASFDDFFPFYMEEHSDLTNRRLHFIGTCAALLVCMYRPPMLVAMVLAGAPWA